MKKLILIPALFLFLLITPKPALAACYPQNPNTGQCDATGSQIRCPDGVTCCSSLTECAPTPTPSQPPAQQSSGRTPTCLGGNGINTAIGCIPFNEPSAFAGFFLGWGVGIGGGIAFLLIAYASFMIMTSSGNPERLKAGQELLTSAIAGLIMIVFSIFILRVVGVNILGIFK